MDGRAGTRASDESAAALSTSAARSDVKATAVLTSLRSSPPYRVPLTYLAGAALRRAETTAD